jgi:hypothetical protein
MAPCQLSTGRDEEVTFSRHHQPAKAYHGSELASAFEQSRYWRHVHYLVAIDDDAGPNSQRASIERNAIALLSNSTNLSLTRPRGAGWAITQTGRGSGNLVCGIRIMSRELMTRRFWTTSLVWRQRQWAPHDGGHSVRRQQALQRRVSENEAVGCVLCGINGRSNFCQRLHNCLHNRRSDTIAKQLDVVATRAMFKAVTRWKSHGSSEFFHLQHSQHRLTAFPSHEAKAIQSCHGSQWTIE